MRTKNILWSVLFFLLFSFNGYALLDKKGDIPSKKVPPRFHIYMENETLYLNPLRSSVSVQTGTSHSWNDRISSIKISLM